MDEHAQDTLRPTNEELQVLFTEALRESGDVTIDCVAESRALWMRGVLPQAQQVRPGDNLRGGVAMRTLGDEVLIHPYVMRQVCTNGAVLSHARSTRIVSRQRFDPAVVSAHSFSLASVSADVTAAVRNCASPEAFSDGVNEMRASLEVDADTVIENLQFADVLSSLGRSLSAHSVFRVLARIMRQASGAGGRERSAFALGNALTSAGRDAASPAVRWTLEEYGAAVFAASLSASAPPSRHAAWTRHRRRQYPDALTVRVAQPDFRGQPLKRLPASRSAERLRRAFTPSVYAERRERVP